jgi:hypothetical protein
MNSNGMPRWRLDDVAAHAPAAIAVVAAVSTVVSAYAAYSQGQQQAAGLRANAQATRAQSDLNARQLNLRADQQRAAAEYEEERQRERTRFMLAEQRARTGAAGIEMEGSPLEVLGFSAQQAELDALAIRQRGRVQVADTLLAAGQQRVSGQQGSMLDEWRAQGAADAGTAKAGSEILTGAGSWYRNYGGAGFTPRRAGE